MVRFVTELIRHTTRGNRAKPYQVEQVRHAILKYRLGGGARYEVIVYWSEEDQAFMAEVPELPGCAADGSTYREALANVEVVIQEWIETAKELSRPIPQPKGRLVFA